MYVRPGESAPVRATSAVGSLMAVLNTSPHPPLRSRLPSTCIWRERNVNQASLTDIASNFLHSLFEGWIRYQPCSADVRTGGDVDGVFTFIDEYNRDSNNQTFVLSGKQKSLVHSDDVTHMKAIQHQAM